jgi:trk system potassium uptake protein TrkA
MEGDRMRFLIVGAGRLGRALAHDLLQAGYDVRVLDDTEERLARLPDRIRDVAMPGSALEHDTLTRALAGCDGVATATRDDAFNAVVALAARHELGVPVAVAVIASPARAESLAGFGAQIVCPTVRTAREAAMALVRSDVDSELQLGSGAGLYRAELPPRLGGRKLEELQRAGELVPVALERGGRLLLAGPGLAVEPGDILHAAASNRALISDLSHP